jgi:transposase
MVNLARKYNVGLVDIHSEMFYGTVMTKQGDIITKGSVKYSKEGIQNFLGSFPSTDIIIAIEACGLARGVYKLLTELGYEVVLANPAKIKSLPGYNKTDKIDSKKLADLLRIGYLPITYIPPEDIIKLRDISRHRAQLVRMRAMTKVRIKSYLSRDGKKFPGKWNKDTLAKLKEMDLMIANFVNIIELLDKQIYHVEKKIKQISTCSYKLQLLTTIPGIADISAMLILGEIGDIKRFNNPKSLVRYAGLCPGVSQSGKKSHDVISNANNKWLKGLITEVSSRAAMLDRRYLKHFVRVKNRKGYAVARRSMARKMMIDIWHILTKEEPFRRSES